jgi:hypothetical protein
MTFDDKRQFHKQAKNNGNGNHGGKDAGPHDSAVESVNAPVPNAAAQLDDSARPNEPVRAAESVTVKVHDAMSDDPMRLPEPARLDERVTRYIPTPPPPRDFGREGAAARAGKQSLKSLRLREHLDCEPPWDILRARASFDSPASPHEPWPDRFDVWPTDMAGYWPCPTCATPLPPVDRTAMKLFRCVGCETETFVHVKAPVVECPRHGRQEIDLPWTQNDVKWTYLGTEPAESGHPSSSSLRDIFDGDETEH